MKKQMKIIILMSILLSGFLLPAQDAGEFTVPLSEPNKRGKLSVHLNYGSVTVKGTPRKDVLVKYTTVEKQSKRADQAPDGLRKISSGTINLEVVENGNAIQVKSDSWSTRMNLELEVPAGIDLKVHTYNNGVLTIQNITGEVELDNYNGPIYASGISGAVLATSYNGEIKVELDKVKEGTPMSFSTYNGKIDITVPSNLKAGFKMKTNRGEVYSDFDMKLVKQQPVQQRDERSGTFKVVIDDWVKGEVNGGGPEFMLTTYNGNIYIRKK